MVVAIRHTVKNIGKPYAGGAADKAEKLVE